jgi:Major Facilitator Superfamily
VFVSIESRFAEQPLVPLGVFRRRSLSAANGVSIALGGALYSLFFLSLYLQQVHHYTPLRAGLAFLPLALSSLFVALLASKLVARAGVRRQLVFGLALAASGVAWLTQLAPGDAAALTTGYDRAFGVGAAVLIGGALVALMIPAKPTSARQVAK